MNVRAFTRDYEWPGRRRAAVAKVEWAVTDSNRRHPACKAGALPTELTALAPLLYRRAVRGGKRTNSGTLLGTYAESLHQRFHGRNLVDHHRPHLLGGAGGNQRAVLRQALLQLR